VDFAAGLIRVERSYDPATGAATAPKSRAGVRKVPIASVLREHLIAHKLHSGRSEGLVFGVSAGTPRSDGSIRKRGRGRTPGSIRSGCTRRGTVGADYPVSTP
jgi:hypothetical protein